MELALRLMHASLIGFNPHRLKAPQMGWAATERTLVSEWNLFLLLASSTEAAKIVSLCIKVSGKFHSVLWGWSLCNSSCRRCRWRGRWQLIWDLDSLPSVQTTAVQFPAAMRTTISRLSPTSPHTTCGLGSVDYFQLHFRYRIYISRSLIIKISWWLRWWVQWTRGNVVVVLQRSDRLEPRYKLSNFTFYFYFTKYVWLFSQLENLAIKLYGPKPAGLVRSTTRSPWTLSLSLIPGQGGVSPPQSSPGSSWCVVGR